MHWASLWGRPQRWHAKGACVTTNKKERNKIRLNYGLILKIRPTACRTWKIYAKLGLSPEFGLRTKSSVFYQVTQCICWLNILCQQQCKWTSHKSDVASFSGFYRWRYINLCSGVTRGEIWRFNPPHSHRSRFFHSRKVTVIKYYNLSLTTLRTINSHNLRKTNHLGECDC